MVNKRVKESFLLTLVGPTASGKSELALRAARLLEGEIVNCDSVQMIRGMDVGTAKPTPEERSRVPHHLFDRIEPNQYYSAGRYMEEARRCCRQICRRGKVPIVVGGTGLYYRALLEGVFQGPSGSQRWRRRLKRIAAKHGVQVLHRLLLRRDPVAAERLAPTDEVRLVRALEVFYLTGRPISKWQPETEPLEGFNIIRIGLNPAREVLYQRINQRVERMFRSGLLDEVRDLLNRGYSSTAKGFQAIGYRQALGVIEGCLTEEEAIASTAQDSRRYAKRQLTWFRKEPGIHWISHPGESEEAWDELRDLLECKRGREDLESGG